MYCKLIKLTNGDTIIGATENDCSNLNEGVLEMINPVLVSTIRIPVDNKMVVESYVLQTWIKIAESNKVRIPVSSVVAVANVVENAERQYNEYVSDIDSTRVSEEEFNEIIERETGDQYYDYANEEDEESEENDYKPRRPIFH